MKKIILAFGVMVFLLLAVIGVEKVNKVKTIGEFDDVRGKSLIGLALEDKIDTLITLKFDNNTVWTTKLPKEFDPKKIMAIGKDPGLGIKALHTQGIIGKGVSVALIDGGPFDRDHQELKGKIKFYKKVGFFLGGNGYHGDYLKTV